MRHPRALLTEALDSSLTPGEIAGVRNDGVALLTVYVCSRSPFYRELFRSAGLTPGDVVSTEDLTKLPTTTKHDIVARNRDFLCVEQSRIIDVVTTSGTTGRPTLYLLTERDLERLAFNEQLSFSCAGIGREDVVFLSVTMDRCFMAGLAYFEGLRRLGTAVLRMGPASPAMHLDLLDRLRPTVVVSVPSFLKRIARYAEEQGRDLAKSSIEKAVCIGEPLRDKELALNPLGRLLEESWGVKVYSTYGVTELATSCCECDCGCGGPLHPELLHLEILDEDGNRVPPGEVGEVVATTFGIEAMPVLRFRTGDYSFLIEDRCRCGRHTPRLGPILGRKDQMLKIKGTTVFPAAVSRALDSLPNVTNYVMIVSAEDALADHLEVVISARGREETVLDEARAAIQGEAKVTPDIRLATEEEIDMLQSPPGSRKRRFFIDRR